MILSIYQIDAFTEKVFGGNPAAVCPLPYWLDDKTMQAIAAENNLSETAFFVKKAQKYEIRWFMPHGEIDLCGHATLAAAFVLFYHLDYKSDVIPFYSKSGLLKAQKTEQESIILNFPSRPPKNIHIPILAFSAFNHKPIEAAASRDLILLFKNEEQIRTIEYDINVLKKLPYLGIAPTAKGKHVDFVSRVFDAQASVVEDPVTGSTHASLIPYWQKKLNKNTFVAHQLSDRKGTLTCSIEDDRVLIEGKAVLYLKGSIYLP